MKKARIGTFWQVYGSQVIELPDEITTRDEAIDWIRDNFDDIPLPEGSYVTGSDELDEESIEFYEG